MEDTKANSDGAAPRTTRGLLLLRAGGRSFAVYADEAEGVAEVAEPVPLPHAPAAVLGVVCVRGRMYTLLDTSALLPAEDVPSLPVQDVKPLAGQDVNQNAVQDANANARVPRFAVALRGDEQLALAADEVEGPLELDADGASPHILDPARLFDAAMRGTERRRQRS